MSSRLGVLGGTFDPVHIGHLVLGERAREQLELDRVVFVPAGHPWRKSGTAITPPVQRLEMLKLATASNDRFEVSTLEIEREGPSYSEVTLGELLEANPGAEMFFILGRDALVDLPNWHDPRRVVELATLVAAERETGETPSEDHAALARLNARIVYLDMPALEISATDIRRRVLNGRSIRYLVPDVVAGYIASHGLYREE